jgi:alpha-L-fucosidase
MATFAHNGDPGCDATNWDVKAPYATGKTSDPATFDPMLLNTTQWMESITALGANIAILTAKHGCGFCLWPTKATLPDGSPYGYSVGAEGAAIQRDVLQEFVDSANAAGVGYGFYYSIMKSFYLCHSFSGTNSCGQRVLPGQRNFTGEQYAQRESNSQSPDAARVAC